MTDAAHPRHRLDPIVHQPVRFSILATLAAAEEADFGFVRDQVEVSDSVLSKHTATLEEAGYVVVRKGYVGKRPRTWLRLTDTGWQTFARHLDTLREIAAGAEEPSVRPSSRRLQQTSSPTDDEAVAVRGRGRAACRP